MAVDLKPMEGQIFLLRPELPSNATVFTNLKSQFQLKASGAAVSADEIAFEVDGGTIQINLNRRTIPELEWLAFANISWLWKGAANELKGHTAYLNVKFTPNAEASTYLANLTFAKVNTALMEALPANALGILISDRYLLLDSRYYTETIKNLPADEAPTYLMVYFGMDSKEKLNSGFTYGLHAFNLPEVEIINSSRSVHEVHGVLYQSVSNLLSKGQLAIDASKSSAASSQVAASEGVYINGKTLKIQF